MHGAEESHEIIENPTDHHLQNLLTFSTGFVHVTAYSLDTDDTHKEFCVLHEKCAEQKSKCKSTISSQLQTTSDINEAYPCSLH